MPRIARALVDGQAQFLVSDDPEAGWALASSLRADLTTLEAILSVRSSLREMVASNGATLQVDASQLLSPVERPGKILAVGLNYHDHVKEVDAEVPAEPFVFVKAPNSINGPYAPIVLRADLSAQPDYEVEMAIVVGETCKDVPESDADAVIAGYAVSNDFSAREWQLQTPWTQWLRAKGMDGFCPLGPWITTSDEIDPSTGLEVTTLVNGEQRQKSSTSQLVFNCQQMISFVSQGVTLEPGDVILTGTPGGVIYGMEGQPWLENGDVVTCAIEGLGRIENTIDS